ncbi:PspC domain-containing protein [Thalassotalea litorea]|uniref:PspC domain-containing protein n=1 Tax=Thalassotalea litorea TaxID=2020715 RepID=A0A5R9IGC8_9GAMM|nr:PspC domain-containing protein [Thalassotalea litorea]TLU64342.1 PspC domain-containing protein [Thalassotalea litorea]
MSKVKYKIERSIAKDQVHKKLCGVCAGLARHFSMPRIVVRVLAILALIMMPTVTLVAYGVAALIMPNRYL